VAKYRVFYINEESGLQGGARTTGREDASALRDGPFQRGLTS
jgi:hypothetical protein